MNPSPLPAPARVSGRGQRCTGRGPPARTIRYDFVAEKGPSRVTAPGGAVQQMRPESSTHAYTRPDFGKERDDRSLS